jgi:xanthine/uracil permease
VPDLYAHVPTWMRPLFDSSLTLATVVAVSLNQLLRWGAARPAGVQTKPAPAEQQPTIEH